MFKSYSTSYSYSSDGKKEKQEYHSNFRDNNKEYGLGFNRDNDLENDEKNEAFYKRKKDDKEFKKLFGKSRNNHDWNIRNYRNEEDYDDESHLYQEHAPFFNKFNQINQSSTPEIRNQREDVYNPLPSLNYMGEYHQDNNITRLPERQQQVPEIYTPQPRNINSILGTDSFRQVSRNFTQFQNKFQNQFNDPFFNN